MGASRSGRGRAGDGRLLRLFTKVCDAIQYAHQRGIIHRDLKPTNTLVDAAGEPKVLDFGLAKWLAAPPDALATVSQQMMGTLPYMSPEQARGNPDEVDTRTDIYALSGAFELLRQTQAPQKRLIPVARDLVNVYTALDKSPEADQYRALLPDDDRLRTAAQH